VSPAEWSHTTSVCFLQSEQKASPMFRCSSWWWLFLAVRGEVGEGRWEMEGIPVFNWGAYIDRVGVCLVDILLNASCLALKKDMVSARPRKFRI
jgi:hypothetical protein